MEIFRPYRALVGENALKDRAYALSSIISPLQGLLLVKIFCYDFQLDFEERSDDPLKESITIFSRIIS